MKKQYYYSFAFSHSDGEKEIIASVYIGYDHKFISIPQIKNAKEGAKINKDAVLLSCCYLGKMTKKEIETGITSRCTWIRKAAALWNTLKDAIRFSY